MILGSDHSAHGHLSVGEFFTDCFLTRWFYSVE